MSVDFALFLSPQGIALAHRQLAGHWALIGEAQPDSPDLAADMAGLKQMVDARGGAASGVILVLPDDQILYTSFMAPVHDPDLVAARIAEGLDGLTPYAVADLVHDWRPIEADRVKVAVIAKETLDEAAGFVAAHGFVSAGFIAMPPAERFPGVPIFGPAPQGFAEHAAGLAFGPDAWVAPADDAPSAEPAEAEDAKGMEGTAEMAEPTVPDTAPDGPLTAPAPTTATDTDTGTDTDKTAPDTTGAADAAAGAASGLAGPAADPTREESAADPTPGESAAEHPAVDTEAEAEAEAEADDAPQTSLAAILDLTLTQPIRPVDATEDADPKGEIETGTDPETGTEPGATPETAAPPATEPASSPIAARGKIDRPGPDGRNLTAEKPSVRPARGPKTGVAAPAAPPADPSRRPAEDPPLLGFGARRGRAPKPDGETGALVSRRRGRLGFGTFADADPIRDPARDPASDAAATLPPDTPAAPNQASKLAAQLARLREVSKRRPKADPATDGPSGLPAAAALTKPGDGVIGGADHGGPAPAEPGPRASVDATLTAPAPRPVPPTTRPSAADAVFTAGLLARKPTAAPGPSMRTGMILTLALLVLLILIALWSVFFLPQSPMARLFGSGGGSSPADVAEATPMPPAAVAGLVGDKAPEPDPEALADAGEADLADTSAASPPLPALAAAEGALPDIDADLDLPPLPQPPEVVLPSLEDTERIYAQDGIWPRPPDPPSFSPFALSDDIYIASIDPDITALDAVALADPRINIAETLRRVPPPPPFGAQLERDARGLIAATPEGVLTPEGAFVVLGRPSVVAPPRPREVATADLALAAPETPAVPVVDAALASFVPRPRPGDLVETRERQLLGGLTVQELSGRRPEPRPLSAQDAAARASLFPGAGDAGNAAPAGAAVAGSERAVASSRVPRLRPATIADMVAEATRGGAQITAAAATTIAPPPSIPTNADVARVATARNEIRLRDINLIGVTGTPSNRSALVRLPSGRFVRVSVGDTLDGGRVAAIGESSLQYVVNGQNVTLDIPG